jgi:hypothetical protein
MPLPTNIRVREEWQGASRSMRFLLPRQAAPPIADTIVGLGFAAGAPLFFGAYACYGYFFAETPPSRGYAVVLLLIGLVVCLVALAALAQVLFNHLGRYELIVQREELLVQQFCGPWYWTRRVPLRGLRGFRIQTLEESQSATATLFADDQQGAAWKICGEYPCDWLAEFADALFAACTPELAVQNRSAVTVENPRSDSYDPRFSQPSSSTAKVSTTAGNGGPSVTIVLPAVGLWRCISLASMAICVFLMAAMGWILWNLPKIIGLTLASDRPVLNLSAGLSALAILFAITLWRMFVWITSARRNAVLKWAPDELEFFESGWIQRRRWRWPAAELQQVQLIQFRVRDDSGVLVRAALVITTRGGRSQEILSWRPRAELEWLATGINQWLEAR